MATDRLTDEQIATDEPDEVWYPRIKAAWAAMSPWGRLHTNDMLIAIEHAKRCGRKAGRKMERRRIEAFLDELTIGRAFDEAMRRQA